MGKKLTDNDNLFIFYAGHGSVKNYNDGTGRKEGFLIPIDAEKGDEVTFINNQDLSTIIKRSNAKHILFTADASFSGAIFRDIPSDAPLPVAQAYRDKSRKLLSGGTIRALSTESDFAGTLAAALQDNKAKYITAGELIGSFKKTPSCDRGSRWRASGMGCLYSACMRRWRNCRDCCSPVRR